LKTLINFESAKSIPIAINTYYPLNHVIINALRVTVNDYPPIPKINLLDNIKFLPKF